jgi:hypothetical protein
MAAVPPMDFLMKSLRVFIELNLVYFFFWPCHKMKDVYFFYFISLNDVLINNSGNPFHFQGKNGLGI